MISVTIEADALRAAALSLSRLTIGPGPSRTNPSGDRGKVLDPRSVVARELPGLANFAINNIRELTPIRSKQTRNSYNVRMTNGGDVRWASKASFSFLAYRVASDLPDSEQVVVNVLEFGSRPHVIRPRRVQWLRFEISGEDFAPEVPRAESGNASFVRREEGKLYLYTKKVNHPGTQPHAMFRKTLDAIVPLSDLAAQRIVLEVTRSFSALDLQRYTTSAVRSKLGR